MDWIEKLTGLRPDGGNGTLEALYYLVLAVIVVCVVVAVHRRASGRGRR